MIRTALWEARAALVEMTGTYSKPHSEFTPQLQYDRHSLEALTMSVSHRLVAENRTHSG